MSAFQQGLMSGAELGRGIYRAQGDRRVGGLMTSGDYTGAAAAAYGQGDLATGQGIERIGQQQAATERGGQIVGALKTGDYEGATSFASTPEELAQITQFRETASEAERTQKAQEAGRLASVIMSITDLPPEQQLSAAQSVAPQFGIDPAQITPDVLQRLPALQMQAMGLADFLTYQDRTADNARMDAQAAETARANRAREEAANGRLGIAASREARVGSGRSSGGRSSGGSRSSGSAPARPSSRPWERY